MKKEENYCIDFLRFIFSICILLYHSWIYAGTFGNGYFNRGYLGVDFYFIVTGWLMINSVRKLENATAIKSSIAIIARKIKKLIPALLAVFIVGFILTFGKDVERLLNLFIDPVIKELFQIGIVGGQSNFIINSALWYISSMMVVMAIFLPFAVKFKDGYSKYIAPIIIMITLAIVNANGININDPIRNTWVFLNGFYKAVIFILLGNISFEITEKIKNTRFNIFSRILLSVVEIVVWVGLIANLHYAKIGMYLFAILLTLNISLTFSGITLSKVLFRSRVWKALGTIGFYVYLCQVPVRAYVSRNYVGDYNTMLKHYITITVGIAFCLYVIIELIYKSKLIKFIGSKIKLLFIKEQEKNT